MQDECVVAEFKDRDSARLGLEVLARAGYGEDHISVVTKQTDSEVQDIDELEKTKTDSRGVPGGIGVGGLLGTAVSIPLAASTLVGPFMLLGPIVGAGVGAALGGMLMGSADKKDPAQAYRHSLNEGGVLLVITGTKAELLEAEASIKTAGPRDVTRFSATEGWSQRGG